MNPYPDAVHSRVGRQAAPALAGAAAQGAIHPLKVGGEEGDEIGDGDALGAVPEVGREPEEAGRQVEARLSVPHLGREEQRGGQASQAPAAAEGGVAPTPRVTTRRPEHLFTEEERAAWEKMDPSDRPTNFVPQAHDAMRKVPLYDNLIKERFDRCLDLYLCPRERKDKLNIDPDSLIPELPKPQELRPYPERKSFEFTGHTGKVYALSVSPDGNSLTAGQDGTVRLWEVSTARCERKWSFGKEEVRHVAFNPSGELDMAVCAVGPKVYLMLPNATGKSSKAADQPHALLSGSDKECGAWVAVASSAAWACELGGDGSIPWEMAHPKTATLGVWHHGGDYLRALLLRATRRAF